MYFLVCEAQSAEPWIFMSNLSALHPEMKVLETIFQVLPIWGKVILTIGRLIDTKCSKNRIFDIFIRTCATFWHKLVPGKGNGKKLAELLTSDQKSGSRRLASTLYTLCLLPISPPHPPLNNHSFYLGFLAAPLSPSIWANYMQKVSWDAN